MQLRNNNKNLISINRNIVECKGNYHSSAEHCIRVLIETLWNVKKSERKGLRILGKRINRNIVECKVFISIPDPGFPHWY